ncbi:MAG: M56 family metallopeptidase [Allomuricauda sp.]
MIAYLLKSAACLTLLLLFYKVFLETQSMNTLKRFYLLASLVLSLTIPSIVFVEYVSVPSLERITEINTSSFEVVTQTLEKDEPIMNFNTLIWSVYLMGVLLFGLKFGKNLIQVIKRIRQNPKQGFKTHIRVLLNQKVVPHTFLKYVFLNRNQLENNEIPNEVLMHEEVHVVQKHSLDILFIELLQVFIWFNPVLVFFKRAIKLNHEFLADEAVLNKNIDAPTYQNTLLAFSSKYNHKSHHPALSNAIHYSSIKKRLTVMKTKTSKQSKLITTILLAPLLTLMIYGFSQTERVVKNTNDHEEPYSNYTARNIDIEILDTESYLVDGEKISKNRLASRVKQLHQDVTPEIRNNIINIHVSSQNEIPNKEVWFIYNSLFEYGFYRIVTPSQEIIKGLGNTPIANENKDYSTSESKQDIKASRSQIKEYNRLAKYYNNMSKDNMKVLRKHVERLTYLYKLMSEKQRKDAEPFPDFPVPPPPPEAPMASKNISDRQRASNMIDSIIKTQDPYDNLNTINLSTVPPKISSTQNIKKVPPPPLPKPVSNYPETSQSQEWPRVPNIAIVTNQKPVSPELKNFFKSYKEKVATYYDGVTRYIKNNTGTKKELMRQYEEIMAMYRNYENLAKAEGVYAIPHPKMAQMPDDPVPPHLKSTIDYIIGLTKKNDAIFFYDDKKITNEKALEILNNNKKVRIKSIFEKEGKSEVKMSTFN